MNIVFDIGGTNMRVAGTRGTELTTIRKVPTPQDPQEGAATFASLAHEIAGGESIESITGCMAGSIDEAGVLSDARNLHRWEGTNIIQAFSAPFSVPIRIVNDAALAGIGEGSVGAGQGAAILAYVTVSTGVGGARIVEGNIDAAGGVGRIQVHGADLESFISGTAVRKKFGIEPKDLESLDERNKLADILAEGLCILIGQWTPDTIVLGGSMIVGTNPIPVERVLESLKKTLDASHKLPIVKMAQLGDNGGLQGAAILAHRGLSTA
jgi:predicted NBD/HSP70 family sugar kinase